MEKFQNMENKINQSNNMQKQPEPVLPNKNNQNNNQLAKALNEKQAQLVKQLAKQEQQIAKDSLQAMLNGQQQFTAATIQAAQLSAQERIQLESS